MKLAATLILGFLASLSLIGADAGISSVVARQRYPWNGKVDITYTVRGNLQDEAERANCVVILEASAYDAASGKTYTATKLSGDMAITEGDHTVTWDLDAEGIRIQSQQVRFTVTALVNPDYCVIDVSEGPNATMYPVKYVSNAPADGFLSDEYKLNKIVLKLVYPGSFIIGSDQSNEACRDTISKPFYMSIFETTQKQYDLIMNARPSNSYGVGDKIAVYFVSYDMIRGSSLGRQWPASANVDDDSVMGIMRQKTGLKTLDIPTEAQWEYACRAGSQTVYCYGDTADGEYMWYQPNASGVGKEVGTRKPNAWGFYDMHGNFWEWCLDWYGTLSYGTDPVGPTSGTMRVLRGGSNDGSITHCRSDYRYRADCSYGSRGYSFRFVRNFP